MKHFKKIISISLLCTVFSIFASGCAEKNTVHSIADLDGKTIGVQLDTVGDTYASDINNAQVKRYFDGSDAIKEPYDFQYHDAPTGGKLVMATSATFPPYEFISDDEVVGFDVDMMKAVCHKINMELVVIDTDFDLVLSDVVKGDTDVGVAGITVTDERLKIVDFSDPYTTATQVVIVRKD